MPKTVTPAPTDRSMWRRLLARVHPDQGGSDELFVWTNALREHLAGGSAPPHPDPPPRRDASEDSRVPFPEDVDHPQLINRALNLAAGCPQPYSGMLGSLAGYVPAASPRCVGQEGKGASYRLLARIGHLAGLSKPERSEWYELARAVPISERMALVIHRALEERAA